MDSYFLKSELLGFRKWNENDIPLAASLWGDPEVTRFVCASGLFTQEDIETRLKTEIENDRNYHVQYWPVFSLESNEFVGCCGLRPYKNPNQFEIGVHIKSIFKRRGYGSDAVKTVIAYAINVPGAQEIIVGHNPHNTGSKALLNKLGFVFTHDEYYEPTGLMHPTYRFSLKQ